MGIVTITDEFTSPFQPQECLRLPFLMETIFFLKLHLNFSKILRQFKEMEALEQSSKWTLLKAIYIFFFSIFFLKIILKPRFSRVFRSSFAGLCLVWRKSFSRKIFFVKSYFWYFVIIKCSLSIKTQKCMQVVTSLITYRAEVIFLANMWTSTTYTCFN